MSDVLDRLRFLHTAALVLLVEAALHVVPLPRLARLCGVRLHEGDRAVDTVSGPAPRTLETASSGRGPDLTPRERRRVRLARRASRRLAARSERGTCLRDALLVGHVLRRHRPDLHIGARLGADGFAAHAWLEIDGATLGYRPGYLPLTASSHA